MTERPSEVLHALTHMPELAALLPAALITRPPDTSGVRTPPGTRPPARLDVLTLLDDRHRHVGAMEWCDPDRMGILPYLWGWCRDLEADAYDYAPELPAELPDPATVSSCCQWLLGVHDFAQTRPQWDEYADGIICTWRRVRAATRGVRDDDPVRPVICNRCKVGHLTQVGTDRLWACDECGREIAVQAVTLPQAAPIVGVSLRTLQRWAWRGLMTRVDDGGAALYDLGDLRRVAAEVRLRTAQ